MLFCHFGSFDNVVSQGLSQLLLVSLAKLAVTINFCYFFKKVPQRDEIHE